MFVRKAKKKGVTTVQTGGDERVDLLQCCEDTVDICEVEKGGTDVAADVGLERNGAVEDDTQTVQLVGR